MAAQQPTYRAFTVIKRGEGQDDFWLAIGAAFQHQDGDGYNIVLQALPIDGKIVLRLPKDDQTSQEPARPSERPSNKTGSRSR
jgi:hypothetical protein